MYMTDCTVCNVCTNPGLFKDSTDVKQISSVVRKFRHEKFTVWRCPSCRSLHSKEAIDLAHYYKYYPLQQHKLDMWARIAYGKRLKRLIKDGVKPRHSILDYGCGQGLFITFLHEKGFRNAVGYDPYVPDFSNGEVLNQSYDVVIAQDVIEHDDDPKGLMEQFLHYLRRGGVICLGTPNADQIDLSKPENFAMPLHQPYHRHILSQDILIKIGTGMGLKVGSTYNRWYYDSFFPTVNYRFILSYMRRAGNVLDAVFEPPHVGMVITSPALLFYALFGCFFPPRSEMMIFFHRSY
jgi:2-polyprenyl-3-methyl-5-hydroxy-6-metoxy-1,4-benzoquinol methylase